jgi:hypothetical protein
VSLDWWQRPSIAPTSSLVVDHRGEHQLEIGEVVRSWPSRNVIAQLVAEPSNPQDRHAVMVLLDGYKIGYLPDARDPRYTAIVKHLAVTQGPVRVRAHITGGADQSWTVVVDGHPECFDPRRHFCAGTRHVVVTTTPEHQHLIDDLADGDEVPAELHLTDGADAIGRSTAEPGVSVALDGIVVGHLGPELGPEYLDLVRAANARGIEATCPATARRAVDGRTTLHLALADDPARLIDVCD